MSCHVVSRDVISVLAFGYVACQIMSDHAMSCRVASCHAMSCHFGFGLRLCRMSCGVVSCHVMSNWYWPSAMSLDISWLLMSVHVISFRVMFVRSFSQHQFRGLTCLLLSFGCSPSLIVYCFVSYAFFCFAIQRQINRFCS